MRSRDALPATPAGDSRDTAAPVAARAGRGRALPLLRIGWVVVAALAVAGFVASLPARSGQVSTLVESNIPLTEADLPLGLYLGALLAGQIAHAIGFCAIGALIAWRRSDDRTALFVALTLVLFGTHNESSLPPDAPAWAVAYAYVFSSAAYIFLNIFLFVFPDGRFVPRWTRLLVPLAVVVPLSWMLPTGNPFAVANWPPLLVAATIGVLWGGALCAQVYRYRRVTSPTQRRQTKWAVAGIVGMTSIIILTSAYDGFFPESALPGTIAYLVSSALNAGGLLLVPLSIGVAILRANLFDIDVIINRALVYGALTAALALVYLGGVAGLGGALRALTGQSGGGQLAIVASTLAVAALFQPLRRRIQATIDRRFYRHKYDAAAVVARFAAAARNETDLDGLTAGLLGTVDEAMRPARVSLWLRPPERRE